MTEPVYEMALFGFLFITLNALATQVFHPPGLLPSLSIFAYTMAFVS